MQEHLRIAPVPDADWTETERTQFGIAPGEPLPRILATLSRHPELQRRWLAFAEHAYRNSTLDPRDRELAILRTGFRHGSRYEFAQHAVRGREVGLTDDDIRAVLVEGIDGRWSKSDVLILRAVDELCATSTIGDDTWAGLARTFDDRQLIDLVFTVGSYTLVSYACNALGVQLDDDLVDEPWLA
jgi:alkylhydroperoxidase family enzyme